MNEHELRLSRLYRPIENSVDRYAWLTESWTARGIDYEVSVWKHTGEVTCTCMDAIGRKKVGHVLDDPGTSPGCKHQRHLIKMLDVKRVRD